MTVAARLALAGLMAGATCVTHEPGYQHNRYDYWAFRSRVGRLEEPNYLPYVTHRKRLPDGRPALVVCRWPAEAFPLAYYVEPPAIPPELQHEFSPRAATDYVEAVHRAVRRWADAIGRPVRFRPVSDPAAATLRVVLEPDMRPAPEGLVGGMAEGAAESCRVLGPGPSPDQVEIAFALDTVRLFIVDSVGLLTPGQVELIALHELGHVLGASGQHSPLAGDLMFRMTDDRRVEALSAHDRNTFRELYQIPPGTVYARLAEAHGQPMLEAQQGPPRLDQSVADPRFGFQVQFPVGWQRIRTSRGWIGVDGVSWDYDASMQVSAVRGRFPELAARQAYRAQARGELARIEHLELDGLPIARFVTDSGDVTEEMVLIHWAEGWVILLLADCRSEHYPLYQNWFRRILLSVAPLDEGAPAGVGSGPARSGSAGPE